MMVAVNEPIKVNPNIEDTFEMTVTMVVGVGIEGESNRVATAIVDARNAVWDF